MSSQPATIFRGRSAPPRRNSPGSSWLRTSSPRSRRGRNRWGGAEPTTVNDAIEGWKQNGWEDLSPVTARRYENVWKVHIEKTIGKRAHRHPHSLRGGALLPKAQGEAPDARPFATSGQCLTGPAGSPASGAATSCPIRSPRRSSRRGVWKRRAEPVRAPSIEEVQQLLAKAPRSRPRYAARLRVVAATGVTARRGVRVAMVRHRLGGRTVTIDESVIPSEGRDGQIPEDPGQHPVVAVDAGTLQAQAVADRTATTGLRAGVALAQASFVFSAEPGGIVPPYPDTVSHSFTKVRVAAKLPKDLHLHSLRHFQATSLDTVIPERQKQARLGWSTVHMARHYTDAISSEDRKAAEHIGSLLDP